MNPQPSSSNSQNQLRTQQQHNTRSYHMPENVFAQPNLNVHYASRINTYKYTRTLKVDDVLNYFDNVHLANNNYETNYLLNIIHASKSQIMDSFIIANHLADLLKNYPAILETFLASKPDNYGIEEPKESGYYFKVSIITNEAERTDSSFCLVHVSSPFLANPCSQIMEVSSSSSGLQRLTVAEAAPPPEVTYSGSHINTAVQIPEISQSSSHQTCVKTDKGKKRQRIS